MRKDHDQTMTLLPWYVNDTLEGRDLEMVLRHLADCRHCQAERDRLYGLAQLVQESDTPVPGHELSFRRVMRRIEAAEENRDSVEELPRTRRRNWLPVGLAASVFSVMVAGAAWFGAGQPAMTADATSPAGSEYQTLSSDQPGSGASRRIELGFANPIPAATLRQALIETDSNIVSGPDKAGNYLVEVVVPSNLSADEYLDGIRRIEGVERARFASDQ